MKVGDMLKKEGSISQVQCNVFEGASGEVALTAAGGLRQLPGLSENFENAALVLLYYLFLYSRVYHMY